MESLNLINEQLITSLSNELYENKAERIIAYSSMGKVTYTDFILLCSVVSSTHGRALSKKITSFLKGKNIQPLTSTKKIEDSTWIAMDYGDLVVHLFYGDTREKYNLEAIFKDLKIINQKYE